MSKRPVVLMVLDGYGLNDNPEGNAIAMAKTPVMDSLMKDYPFWQLVCRTVRWVTLRLDI